MQDERKSAGEAMSGKYLKSSIDILRLLIVIGILILIVAFVVMDNSQPLFLSSSIAIALLALVNYLALHREGNSEWKTYALLLFFAMVCGTIGDFLMAGIIYITPEPLINGILLFGIGHVFYLMGLRNRSPLLLRKRDSGGTKLIARNLIIWIVCVVIVLAIFYFTVFNSAMLILSIGALGYGILLVTVLAFAITKWASKFSLPLRIALVLGFFLFLFSDWLIAYHEFTDPAFLSGAYVGITYAIGQLLIQLTPFLGSRAS
ncbi:MAG: hypothetical protein C4K48_11835 [Candidatus Thorarchaeota archaeon]|nr:MAG: hypothetical protein C4K48_11835 [Candidatus Thorarchaeota archaeon]